MTAIIITSIDRPADRDELIKRLSAYPGFKAQDESLFVIQADFPEQELRDLLCHGFAVPPSLRIHRMTVLTDPRIYRTP